MTDLYCPTNPALERDVLAEALTTDEAMEIVAAAVQPDDFTDPLLRKLYGIILDLLRKNIPIDKHSVGAEADKIGMGKQLTGLFIELAIQYPSCAFTDQHVDKLVELSSRRRLFMEMRKVLQVGAKERRPLVELCGDVVHAIGDITARQGDTVHGSEETIQYAYQQITTPETRIAPIPFGYEPIDRRGGMLYPDRLIMVGGRPGQGKTSFGMHVMLSAASAGHPTLFVSTEMSFRQLAPRVLAWFSRVPSGNGELSDAEYLRLAKAIETGTGPYYVDYTKRQTVLSIRSRVLQCIRRYGVKLLIIDYFGRLRPVKRLDSREREYAEIVTDLKSLAGELQIPIILLCQLNRSVEQRGEFAEPRNSDIRETGVAENEADTILLIHHESEPDEWGMSPVNFRITKNRDAPCGRVLMEFNGPLTLFQRRG